MKRNMDLARQILMEIEEHGEFGELFDIHILDTSEKEIWYHIMLLNNAGLIEAAYLDGDEWAPKNLTWEGHEFLDAARDETRWNKAKDIVKDKGGGLTFDVVKALLIQLAREAVGLH